MYLANIVPTWTDRCLASSRLYGAAAVEVGAVLVGHPATTDGNCKQDSGGAVIDRSKGLRVFHHLTYAADPEPCRANSPISAAPALALSLRVAGAVLGAASGAGAVLEPTNRNKSYI